VSISDSITTSAKLRGLFAYYKIRCPEGSFHIFADGKCKKCEFNSAIAGEERAKYAEKYMSTYDSRNTVAIDKNHTKTSIENMQRDRSMVVVHKSKDTVPRHNFRPWVNQNNAITAASKLWPQLPYNLLINISFGSQIHFINITSGKANPSNNATDVDYLNQANAASGYANTIAISFNKLISCTTRGMHPDLADACEKQSDVIRGLTPIDMTEFYAEQAWRRENDKPGSYANWMINKLCEMLLEINSRENQITKRFAEIMADMIAESELNMSKSIVYKNIMIAAAKSSLGVDAAGDEIEAPETDVEAKEFIKSIVDEGENFATGDVDVDDFAASRGDDDI
jgi:hypothetical protein